MKKLLLFLLLAPFMGILSLKADVSQSFKIDEQTGVFSARFTVVPSAAGVNGAVGLGGNVVNAWGDFNCILRFAENNVIDAFNGADTPGYTADVVLPYIPNRRYYVQMDIDVPNSKYTVWVTPPGEATVALATDYTFRSNTLTGAINYFSTRIVNPDVSIGVLNFQVGTQTAENNHYNFNTQVAEQTGDFAFKLVATPSHDNMDGAFALSSMKAAAWNELNAIMQFNADGTIKAYNSNGYQAISAIPYVGGERYMFLITGSTATKTYNVEVVSPDGSIATLATDYGFRLNGPADGEKVEFIAQRVVQTNHPGAYIAIDGVEIGALKMDGVNPAFVQAMETQTGVFSKEFVVIPNKDAVDAAITFNEADAAAWGGMSAMIQFNQAGLIKVRNNDAYESLVDVPYKALGAYHFKVDFDVATDKYSVSVRSNPQEDAVVIATDYTFRNPATELNYMVNKSTWDDAWGVPGGYLTVTQAAIPVSIQAGNNAPTINPIENFSFYLPDGSRTIDLTGISDGDGNMQTVTVTVASSDETVATVEVLNFTSGESTAELKINALKVGTTNVTVTVKDDGGTDNGGVDETTITFDVEILEWSSVRDLTIRANEGEWGAVNRVLTGNQSEGANYETWLTHNTGGARRANDNTIINRDDRFQYAMYIRFDLGSLPTGGSATDAKFQVYTNVEDYDRDSIVLFVLEDQFFPVRTFQGFDDQELDEFYIEGDEGAWVRVYEGTTGNWLQGKENWITSDNAPGFNEGNLVDLGPGWNIYNEAVLMRIGDMHTLHANDSILTIEHDDIAQHITEDSNGVIVFVLGKLAQNSWAQRVEVYSNHDLGKEPRISFTWDDNVSVSHPTLVGSTMVNVFPNPAKGTVYFSNAENMDYAVIYNIQGRAVQNIQISNSSGSIDVSELPAGMYIVEFKNRTNQNISRSKLMVW